MDRIVLATAGVSVLFLAACAAPESPDEASRAGTPELRAALFDTIVARTERREAWSPVKNETLGFDPLAAMRAQRESFVAADTDEELYYALARLSHARRDRHLDVALVPGGLQLPDSAGLEVRGSDEREPLQAPVRIFPDMSVDGPAYFVGDVAAGASAGELPPIGSRVVAVHGRPVAEWHAAATAYTRHSTVLGLRWKLAEALSLHTAAYPPDLRDDELVLTVRTPQGSERTYALPYADPRALAWGGVGEPAYPGFEPLLETVTFDLLVNVDGGIAILVWTGFRETMVEDVDALMELAAERGMLDDTLIVDVTRSGGGSRGAYAVQRLQGKPFRTTFGNLRISDVTLPFVEDRRAAFERRALEDGGVPETIDSGAWLMEWLEEDVVPAVERGDDYTTTVPFKSAHAPKDSDGVLQPARVHFRGPFAVISGPSGGSHLDQFIHQVVDNDLGPVVGMPPGGYSNTWEWEETLFFPGTDRPVAEFMWNIGHTVTPGGEIAEGNPAEIDVRVPLTPDNVEEYYAFLLEAALGALREGGG